MGVFGSMGVYAGAFAVGVIAVLACAYPPNVSYRCSPEGPEPRCPERYLCCSDDPAALDLDDLDGVALPAYEGRGGTGTPLFSAARNDMGSSGLCVEAGSVPPLAALVEHPSCPVPCNPTWSAESVEAICGESQRCCQTVELELEDCVLDPVLGDAGCWRPVRGEDIEGLGGLDATRWSADAHATLQDPGGQACEAFVTGLPDDTLDSAGVERDAVRAACYRQLSVANQRGFCLGAQLCPLAQPAYRDACEQQNDVEGRSECPDSL